ncbi:hypothetical protein [Hydrocarboniclastica marina]|uniref:Uncharacterized protein n=1 Tax=Hydrocarboniclastica marina TaxID=2259620 RepID=A0A4P7XF40_9ALTE|nr:hypothetical protein [Hydrocarboniclastica marina]MAL97092.1 hypothetical protein [Alteromonadaceae bacterium]QCF25506.1 hypothetical protein soil367_05940 [Hydrocarboniclastica marina]|tara:strand:+ start:272 stop:913 length:642 start_codon:yes stop_codon:yes gene_type:complete
MGLFGTSASSSAASQSADQAKVAGKKAAQGAGKVAPQERILSDDDVTLSAQRPADAPKVNLALKDYKHSVAQDVAFVRDTLRHKLSEYNVPLDTRMGISKGLTGRVEIDAQMPDEARNRIEQDLNQSQAFKGAFERLSVNQPTLDYVDNVTKLSQAYGIRNNLFDSLISRDGEFNGLQDIAHRYQSVRQTLPENAGMDQSAEARYQFSVNARA